MPMRWPNTICFFHLGFGLTSGLYKRRNPTHPGMISVRRPVLTELERCKPIRHLLPCRRSQGSPCLLLLLLSVRLSMSIVFDRMTLFAIEKLPTLSNRWMNRIKMNITVDKEINVMPTLFDHHGEKIIWWLTAFSSHGASSLESNESNQRCRAMHARIIDLAFWFTDMVSRIFRK